MTLEIWPNTSMRTLPLLFLPLFLLPHLLWAGEPLPEFFSKDKPFEIEADVVDYNKNANTYRANGNVVIRQEKSILRADEVIVDMAGGKAHAQGHIETEDGQGNRLAGEALDIDINGKTAVLINGRLYFKEGDVYISGPIIRKTGEKTYEAEDTTYTTCKCAQGETPAWSFYTGSSKVTFGGYFTGWHAVFYAKNIPLLYTPFIAAPIKGERETGFLVPKIGYSDLRGFVLDNAFFWAISDNADATFYLDTETQRGVGEGAEFRWWRTPKAYSELFLYHFRDEDLSRIREAREDDDNMSRPMSADADRWEIRYKHRETLRYGVQLKADIHIVSDDEYFLDFAETSKGRGRESLESTVSLTKNWTGYSLITQLRWFDNLLVEDDETVLQKLPEVTFKATNKKILGTPVYYSLDTTFVNFERDAGVEGMRLDIQPRFSLPLRPGGYFDLTPSITPRWTTYHVEDDTGDKNPDRGMYKAEIDATTTFIRNYKGALWGMDSLQSRIRPKLTYTYIPDEDQDHLPYFDSIDRIEAVNKITYSLKTTLVSRYLKGETPIATSHIDRKIQRNEVFNLEIGQTYDIREERRKTEGPMDERRPFSDITTEIELRPFRYAGFKVEGDYDVYDDRWDRYEASLDASDQRGDELGFAHRYKRETDNKYFEVHAKAHIYDPLDLTFVKRYTYEEDNKNLETEYGVKYNSECWGVRVTYSDRIDEELFLVTFDLKGLGSIGGIRGGFGG
ncbi:MAG: LPS-assembly protein LptD [Deltaproteobacteria bacterium]|nr:LPS-assembly protein LptD [Deltaproteobacteria bacterium]